MAIDPINVRFPRGATPIKDLKRKVISSGKETKRVNLAPGKSDLYVALASSTIYPEKPKTSILDKLFGRVMILKIKDETGKGYIKVNAESLRKRLGLGSKEFKKILKAHPDQATEKIQSRLEELTKPDADTIRRRQEFEKIKKERDEIASKGRQETEKFMKELDDLEKIL